MRLIWEAKSWRCVSVPEGATFRELVHLGVKWQQWDDIVIDENRKKFAPQQHLSCIRYT